MSRRCCQLQNVAHMQELYVSPDSKLDHHISQSVKIKVILVGGLLGATWGRVGVGNRWETTTGSVFDNITDRKPPITHPGGDTPSPGATSVIK